MKIVTEANYVLYAANAYHSPTYDTEEFYDDLKRVSYIKRLFNRYHETGELKHQLIINHLVVLYNVFETATDTIIFHKLRDYLPQLVPFLVFLNKCPQTINNLNPAIHISDVMMNYSIINILREAYNNE